MRESGAPSSSLAIRFPAAGVEAIDSWAEMSGLPSNRFYSAALTLGARVHAISLEPLVALDGSLRTKAGHSTNTSVTDELLVRLVQQDVEPGSPDSSSSPESRVVVSIASDLLDRLDRIAHACGIDRGKLHALSLATGVQLLSSTLSPESTMPLDLMIQIADGSVSPEALLATLVARRPRGLADL